MNFFSDYFLESTRLDEVQAVWLAKKGIQLKVLRLDMMHPDLGGNKWFKLKRNLKEATKQQKETILSFGGAYSNHLRSLAAAGNIFGINTIGLVRGEIPNPLNPVLKFAHDNGMGLVPIDRKTYRLKTTQEFLAHIKDRYKDPYIIPEGGNNWFGVAGAGEIVDLLPPVKRMKRIITIACGTGATVSGLILGLVAREIKKTEILGISVLNAPGLIAKQVKQYLPPEKQTTTNVNWKIEDRFHCGGYAKINSELESFLSSWKTDSEIPIEAVYTGKLFWGLRSLIEQGAIEKGSEVIAIHSGGIFRDVI